MNATHKLRNQVTDAINKLKEAKYRLPIDSIEYFYFLSFKFLDLPEAVHLA